MSNIINKAVKRKLDKMLRDVERDVWRDEIEKQIYKENPTLGGFERAVLASRELSIRLDLRDKVKGNGIT